MNIFVVSSHNNIIKCLLNKIYGDKQHTDEINFQYCAIVKITISGSFYKDMRDVEKLKFETKFLHEGQVKNNKNSEYKYLEFEDRVFDDTNNQNMYKFLNEFDIRPDHFKHADNSSSFEYVFYLISNAEPPGFINLKKLLIAEDGVVQAENTAKVLFEDIEKIDAKQKKIRFYASDLASSRATIAYCIQKLYNYYKPLSETEDQTDIESEMIILPCSVEIANVDKCNDYPVKDFTYKKHSKTENYSEKFNLPSSNFIIDVNLQLYFRYISDTFTVSSILFKCATENIIKMIIENKDLPSLIKSTGGKKGGKKYNRTRSGLRSFRANGRKNRSRKMRTANRVKHIF
jgi:hypothetical protein